MCGRKQQISSKKYQDFKKDVSGPLPERLALLSAKK